jgi:hypothetical protein
MDIGYVKWEKNKSNLFLIAFKVLDNFLSLVLRVVHSTT